MKLKQKYESYLKNRVTTWPPYKLSGFISHLYNGSTYEQLLIREKNVKVEGSNWGWARKKPLKELWKYEQYSVLQQYLEGTSLNKICLNLRISNYLVKRFLIKEGVFREKKTLTYWKVAYNSYLANFTQSWSLTQYKRMKLNGLSDEQINAKQKGKAGRRKLFKIKK